MNYTEYYQLPQWEKTDRVLMEDFNKAMATMEGMPKMVFGSYLGDGKYGAAHPNVLTFPFPPKFLVVFPSTGGSQLLCLRDAAGGNTASNGHSYGDVALTWDENTVRWHTINSGSDASYQLNHSNVQYMYLALG